MRQSIAIQPMQYASLPELHEVEALSDKDAECLGEIREVLLRHGKLDRFAIHLVHKHFDLAEDEILCEFTDSENRVLTMRPLKRTDATDLVETTWRLADGAALASCIFACYPVRGAKPPHINRHSGRRTGG